MCYVSDDHELSQGKGGGSRGGRVAMVQLTLASIATAVGVAPAHEKER